MFSWQTDLKERDIKRTLLPTRINEGRKFAAEAGQLQSESAAGGMMPLISDVPEVTQETKNRVDSTKSDRVNSNLERKLQSIEARPTEVEGSEKRELVVEDAGGVRTMGSPKVDAVAGDAGSKGTPPDKVASSSSSSCKGGLDSGGSPAAPAIKSGSGSTRGDEGVPEGSPDVAGPPAESSSSAAPSVASHGGGSGGPRWDEDILHLLSVNSCHNRKYRKLTAGCREFESQNCQNKKFDLILSV